MRTAWTASYGLGLREILLEAYFSISSSFLYMAHKNGLHLASLFGTGYLHLEEARLIRSEEHLQQWTFRILGDLQPMMERVTNDGHSGMIKRLQQFIQERLHKDVSLQMLADHVYVHPTHLSRIYKMETGENISDYLCRLRMEKAAHLLTTGDRKIYEIAEQTGYRNPHYFIKVFKKYYGLTPQEYRES
ncbi:helix-turn-helix domain-containing protein [Paenibacillus dokdonensis]|uniref:helix-turn-helix domain-containing protein n=1 Tax=Paenibacillus dokdonensis TaxID=2567944 RepID=UPI0010A83B33|nr:helix-turn-helix domain-containing protein [Paenibacillus dokdonensis]